MTGRPMPPGTQVRIPLANPKRRVRGIGVALFLTFCMFAVQLINLHLLTGAANAEAARRSRMETVVLSASRGVITDTDGNVLATTVAAKDIMADQTQIVSPKKTAALLAPLLGLKKTELTKRLTGESMGVYLARRVSLDTWDKVKALDLVGIFGFSTTKRVYPGGKLAGNILGFVGDDGAGLSGLESSAEEVLRGQDGKKTIEVAPSGGVIPDSERILSPAQDGTGLRLTIDENIQALAERLLSDRVKEVDAKSGDAIVINPETGEILAMATAPRFDPNRFSDYPIEQLGNAAVQQVFEPGSTGKIMTMAAVLEEGTLSATSKLTVPSGIKVGGTTFHDHDDHGKLHLTLNGVLAQSSNIGSIMAAKTIGQKKLYNYMRSFGVGETTGSGLQGEVSGSLPKLKDWSGTTFPTLAFGQGYSVTALQMATVFSTIANDGKLVQPHVIAGKIGTDGSYREAAAAKTTQVVSAATAKTVREMLESAVSDQGTAPQARIPGYRVAGKTGTANRYDSKAGRYSGYTASFIGMAPAEDPKLVIAVMIHEPTATHFGSTVSAPVFKELMTYSLARLKIAPSTTKLRAVPIEW